MCKKAFSLLLAMVMLLSVVAVTFAEGEAKYVTLTIEYYIQDNQGADIKIAPTYQASLLPGSDYSVASPSVAGYKVADDGQVTVTGTLGEDDTTIQVAYTTVDAEASYTIHYMGR